MYCVPLRLAILLAAVIAEFRFVKHIFGQPRVKSSASSVMFGADEFDLRISNVLKWCAKIMTSNKLVGDMYNFGCHLNFRLHLKLFCPFPETISKS